MSQKNRTELRKKDFLVVRQTKNQNIAKVITPQTFQVGLDDAEFNKALIVKGNAQVEGRLTDSGGNAFIKGSGNVTVTEDSSGGVTITAALSSAGALTGGPSGGFTTFSYDGSGAESISILTDPDYGGLEIDPTTGLRIKPDELTYSLSSAQLNAGDYVIVGDSDDGGRAKKVLVGSLLSAASGISTLANSVSARDGLTAATFDNTTDVNFDINPGTGLAIVGGGGTGGAVFVDPSNASSANVVATDSILFYDASAGETRKTTVQNIANIASSYSVSAGTGLTGTAYDGSGNSTFAIDTSVVPRLGTANTFSGDNTFSNTVNVSAGIQIAPGTPLLVAGTNVSLATAPNGQVTISSTFAPGGSLTAGDGIKSFTYDGSSSTTIAVSADGLTHQPAPDRGHYVIVADNAAPDSLTTSTIGDIADSVDRTAIVNAGQAININYANPTSDPATFSVKFDNSTITLNSAGQLQASGVTTGPVGDPQATYLVLSTTSSLDNERVLTAGTGLQSTDSGANAAFTMAIDNSVVATLTGSQFSGNVGITGSLGVEGNAIFATGLSGSLQTLADGTPYLREGSNIVISTGSDGSITISSVASGGGSPGGGNGDRAAEYLVLSATGSLDNERVITAGTGISTLDAGAGSTYTISVDNSVVATLTGSVFTGDVVFQSGLSGSLQTLADGTAYLTGAGGIEITTASNGQITISGSAGRIYTAGLGLDLASNEFSIDNSIVATLTGSVFTGDAVFEAGLSGSLQTLSDGITPYIIGTGSITVTTSSSGQLVISSSATGGGGGSGVDVVSQAGGITVNNVTTMVFTSSCLTDDGGGQVTVQPVIGAAEDGTYTDGLFTDFAYCTPIGTAVDRFNEILLQLSPSPAPALTTIDCNDSGVTAYLSFGSSSPTAGFEDVGSGAGYGTSVDVNEQYTVASSGGNFRQGIFTAGRVFDGTLNYHVSAADYGNGNINYPAYSFGDANQGKIALEVNGTIIHTASMTDPTVGSGVPGSGTYSTLNANGSGFTQLSQTGSARFNDGSEFTYFQHRTGEWKVVDADQRDGWNYARVVQIVNSTTSSITNYVEWVRDSNTDPLTATNNQITAVDVGGLKELSGVKYFKSGSVEYRVDVENAYRTVYDLNSITFNTTNLTISSQAKPTIDTGAGEDSSKVLSITGSSPITDETLLNGSVAASINVTHPLKSNLTAGGATTASGFLLYNVADNSTATTETFRGESYRVQSASFDLQSDVTGGSYDWDSSLHMSGSNTGHADGLLFYNDELVAPTNSLLSGDFRNSSELGSLDFAPDGNPDYTGITTGTRTFYRKFQNTTGDTANSYAITFAGSGTSITGDSGTLDTSNIKVYVKLPDDGAGNATGWLDLATLFTSGTYVDGSGARVYSAPGSLSTTVRGTFGTYDIADNDYIVTKILADASWAGDISQLDITFDNSDATPAPDLVDISSVDSGVDAKLSFGTVKPVADFTNVGSSAGVGSAGNTNDDYLDGVPNARRLGIFDLTTDIDGPINTDSSSGGFSDGHTGTLKLEVNGSEVPAAEIDLAAFAGSGYPGSGASSSVNANGTGFTNVSTAQPRTGSNNYPDFDEWFRTARFNVDALDQRNGWNYARAIHTVGGSDRTTTYVEWVNDFYTVDMSYPSIGFDDFGGDEVFYLSGVKYFDNISGNVTGSLKAEVSGSHSNIYSRASNAFSSLGLTNLTIDSIEFGGTGYVGTTVLSDTTVALPALDTAVSDAQSRHMHVTASYTCTLTNSLPEDADSVSTYFRVLHPQKSTKDSGVQSKSTFLIFSASDSSTVDDTENFSGEYYRLISGSYNTKADITDISNVWDSSANINTAAGHDNGLLIYDGGLHSPKQKGNSGDFSNVSDGGLYQGPDGNVDYSTLTKPTREYYRAFRNDTASDLPEMFIEMTGDAEIIPRSGAFASGSLGANKYIYVDVKIPGQTEWLDLAKAGDTSNDEDGDGCLKGTLDGLVDSGGCRNNCSFQGATANGTEGNTPPVSRQDYVIIRIVADEDWTGRLDSIVIDWSTS